MATDKPRVGHNDHGDFYNLNSDFIAMVAFWEESRPQGMSLCVGSKDLELSVLLSFSLCARRMSEAGEVTVP